MFKTLKTSTGIKFVDPSDVSGINLVHDGKIPDNNKQIWNVEISFHNGNSFKYPDMKLHLDPCVQIYVKLLDYLFPDRPNEIFDIDEVLKGA